MNVEQPGGFRGCFLPRVDQLDDFLLLIWLELGFASAYAALLASGFESADRALSHHGTLELCEEPDDLHHHSAGRRGGVYRFGQASEAGAFTIEGLDDGQQVLERAREPVELPDHHDIAITQIVEQMMQLGPVPAATGGLFLEDGLAAGGFQGLQLEIVVLVLGRDPRVADDHELHKPLQMISVLQRRYAPRNPSNHAIRENDAQT